MRKPWNRNALIFFGVLDTERWDYIPLSFNDDSWCTSSWSQDPRWGHESKYGNKRFSKSRLAHR